MTLSDSWDTSPSNPNNRHSSVHTFKVHIFCLTYDLHEILDLRISAVADHESKLQIQKF